MWSITFAVVFCLCIASSFALDEDSKLRSVTVIFRHGDRVPEPIAMYPKDPFYDYDYYPIDLGGLTNRGKRRAFEFGENLRKRYNDILGNLYVRKHLLVRSTDFERTRMSALLALAGMYQPKGVQLWNRELPWQPIPVDYESAQEDFLLLSTSSCPRYRKELARIRDSSKYKTELLKYDSLMGKLSEFTGLNITDTTAIYELYHTLTSERGFNLTLPKWTLPYYPSGAIKEATLFEYRMMNYNILLRRLNGGMILRQVIDDMKDVAKEKPMPTFNMYCGHEHTVAGVLWALDAWKPQVPEYTSAVIMELWEDENEHYVKIIYYKGIPAKFEERTIGGCFKYCHLEDFEQVLDDVLPDNPEKECFE